MAGPLQRDLAAGVIAKDLEADGFYGEEAELYGYSIKENSMFVPYIGMEEAIAESYYTAYLAGKCLSGIQHVRKRIYYQDENDLQQQMKSLEDSFRESLCHEQQIFFSENKNQTMPTPLSDYLFGFSKKPEEKDCFANAYFPVILKEWERMKWKGINVSDIHFYRKTGEPIPEQLRAIKNK